MAIFSRARVMAWKIMWSYSTSERYFLSPAFWSKLEAKAWFEECVNPGDDVVIWEWLCGCNVVDLRDNWYLECYGLSEHIGVM